jgi:predicted dienelactone hydrolase
MKKESKHFFFEKKKQKTFIHGLSRPTSARARVQKFFGSFFQKRTFFLPFLLCAAAPARPGVDAPALAALGPYAVGVATLELVQPDQLDLAKDGKTPERMDRHLPLRVWYPARAGGTPITYHSALPGPDEKPVPFTIPGIAVADAPPAAGRFPLVILAHGYNNTPEVLAWLGENLATKGYVVVAPAFRDPPAFGGSRILEAVVRRPLDIAFVAAEVTRRAAAGEAPFAHADTGRVALIGYSMGGYGVLTAAGAPLDPSLAKATSGVLAPYVGGAAQAGSLKVGKLKAVVSMSPPMRIGPLTMWAPGGLASIRVPTFFIVGSQDHLVGYDPGVRTLFEAETGAARYLLVFREAGHDIALSPPPPAMQDRLWDQDWFQDPVWRQSRLNGIEAHFITAFLDRFVKGDAAKASYIDGLVVNSDDGTWPKPPAGYGAFSPGPPAATLWKGFAEAHAAGMSLEVRGAKP